ncbi:DUF7287 family protein [Natrinema salsiterrestre]|uniref:Pilin/flagellin n=1 Tax=Natrinema salsiterrestre TaxID=2950540 RepID=A0A9Q4L4H1_9EURY|nr:hypothetical protein [Natrinema salsiterrestre]MDF9746367.1 hypothetical protein [Natrinema salsiterrestre]
MIGKRTQDPNRDDARRPRTISISLADRGQTTQDFAVGIGVFLLAIAFVFSFLPSVITPYDSSVGGAETAQADRIADLIVHDVSTETPNEIARGGFGSRYAKENLTAELGLRASDSDNVVFDRVNVSVETFDGNPVDTSQLSGGEVYDDQSAASSARIVTLDPASNKCDPACRLVVRVW